MDSGARFVPFVAEESARLWQVTKKEAGHRAHFTVEVQERMILMK